MVNWPALWQRPAWLASITTPRWQAARSNSQRDWYVEPSLPQIARPLYLHPALTHDRSHGKQMGVWLVTFIRQRSPSPQRRSPHVRPATTVQPVARREIKHWNCLSLISIFFNTAKPFQCFSEIKQNFRRSAETKPRPSAVLFYFSFISRA